MSDVTSTELTTMDLFIVAPRPAALSRRRARAAEHRAAGVVRHRPDRSARTTRAAQASKG